MGVTIAVRRGLLALLTLAVSLAVAAPARSAAQAKGIDVSVWNGQIDWIRVASGGYSFVFGKATEGTTLIDPTYSINRAGTEAFGIRFGAYHFARPAGTSTATIAASAITQADHFVDVAQPQAGELPPVLDLEAKGTLTTTQLQQWVKAWLDEVYARTGIRGTIYVSPNFWKTAVADSTSFASSGTRLWIAHWTKNAAPIVPAKNWGGKGWTWWQWTDCSTVPGFVHCSDGDRMNGNNPATTAIAHYPGGAAAVATAPSVVGSPVAGKILTAVPGVWSGGKPVRFSYQWQRCDAAGQNCVPIVGQVAGKYVPTAADVGSSIEVAVTATNTAGTATAASGPTVAIAKAGTTPGTRPQSLTPPTVEGTLQAGQELTADVGTWAGSPGVFSYQWQRCDATGLACVVLPDGGAPQYTVTPADIGSTLQLLVTASSSGGEASAASAATSVVVPAPLPPPTIGSQIATADGAGNVQTTDGAATVTWQPGAVPPGLTVVLAPFAGGLSLPNTGIALGVADLPPGGFPWPTELAYAAAPAADTVLGYSTDATIYAAVPALATASLPDGKQLGYYLVDGVPHVLTRVPVRIALFQKDAWGDPSLASVKGPTLVQHSKIHVVVRKDKTALVLTRFSTASQVKLSATIVTATGKRVAVIPTGSRFAGPVPAGRAPKSVVAQVLKPGGIEVRLRVNQRFLPRGTYVLRIVAVDPWGRTDTLALPFEY
ncbi:MAG TPA: glycoside hydrolase family 25 protein [Gaiellaceae bacterium]|nr:glycoside hydrolase family 25 protein [Gaiellaceae bacterium]